MIFGPTACGKSRTAKAISRGYPESSVLFLNGRDRLGYIFPNCCKKETKLVVIDDLFRLPGLDLFSLASTKSVLVNPHCEPTFELKFDLVVIFDEKVKPGDIHPFTLRRYEVINYFDERINRIQEQDDHDEDIRI